MESNDNESESSSQLTICEQKGKLTQRQNEWILRKLLPSN